MITIICLSSSLPGQLSSAVISATVRDASKGQTIPASVQYTLSSSHKVHSIALGGGLTQFSHSVYDTCSQ